MKKTVLLLLALTGCAQPEPLDYYTMISSEQAFVGVDKKSFLDKKLSVNHEVISNDKIYFTYFPKALEDGLNKANLLSADSGKAEYEIHAEIKEVKNAWCMMGSCDSGSAVKYHPKQSMPLQSNQFCQLRSRP